MKDYGGFEHNLQSLRVVDLLEERYAEFPGLNLLFETREGILKHCSRNNAVKLGDLGRRFLEGGQPGLEAQVANIADEIAYNNHDVDDGLRSGLITTEQLKACELFSEQYEIVCKKWPELSERRMIHEIVRRMINSLVSDLIATSRANIDQHQPADIDRVRSLPVPLIGLGADILNKNQQLKQFLRKNLYQHDRVQQMTGKAKQTVKTLFEIYMKNPGLLPKDALLRLNKEAEIAGESGRARVIADYIAGMTDRFASAELERIV
jgi:dGTPase